MIGEKKIKEAATKYAGKRPKDLLSTERQSSFKDGAEWEQRRYEIAKDMLSVMYIDEGQESRKGNHNIDFEFKDINSCVREAVRWADTLIDVLKKTSK